MLIDSLVSFVPVGTNLSMVTGAGANVPSPLIYDILGLGVGVAPNVVIGNAALFGSDLGEGDGKPVLQTTIGTAFATADAATLNVAFQGAPDTGAGGGYQPGVWQTLVETGPLTATQLTAGQRIAKFDWPPAFPDNLQPRYLRLLFQIAAGTQFTAGTIAYSIVTMARFDAANRFAASNYRV